MRLLPFEVRCRNDLIRPPGCVSLAWMPAEAGLQPTSPGSVRSASQCNDWRELLPHADMHAALLTCPGKLRVAVLSLLDCSLSSAISPPLPICRSQMLRVSAGRKPPTAGDPLSSADIATCSAATLCDAMHSCSCSSFRVPACEPGWFKRSTRLSGPAPIFTAGQGS